MGRGWTLRFQPNAGRIKYTTCEASNQHQLKRFFPAAMTVQAKMKRLTTTTPCRKCRTCRPCIHMYKCTWWIVLKYLTKVDPVYTEPKHKTFLEKKQSNNYISAAVKSFRFARRFSHAFGSSYATMHQHATNRYYRNVSCRLGAVIAAMSQAWRSGEVAVLWVYQIWEYDVIHHIFLCIYIYIYVYHAYLHIYIYISYIYNMYIHIWYIYIYDMYIYISCVSTYIYIYIIYIYIICIYIYMIYIYMIYIYDIYIYMICIYIYHIYIYHIYIYHIIYICVSYIYYIYHIYIIYIYIYIYISYIK